MTIRCDSAINIMTRHLQKNGMTLDPSSLKKVTLKVLATSTHFLNIPFSQRYRGNSTLQAMFGDNQQAQVTGENAAFIPPFTPHTDARQRSVEGATMLAVTALLNDARFVGYLNR